MDSMQLHIDAWLIDFAAAPSQAALTDAFAEVIASEPENVSARVAVLGLAAGEVVAAVAGSPRPVLPHGVTEWAKANAPLADQLSIEARIAAGRVHEGAEVAALGTTPSPDVAGCKDRAAELLTRLG